MPKLDARPEGLSPLARGNLAARSRLSRSLGPIPARAGQPCFSRFAGILLGAYPRSRGATELAELGEADDVGLSPLARGNLVNFVFGSMTVGPIPARAGQPPPRWRTSRSCRAYPRSRGATRCSQSNARRRWGLSPLARGNRTPFLLPPNSTGPIPARAGQPCWRWTCRTEPWAYPRSRGATSRTCRTAHSSTGLSPLARGNLRSRNRRMIRWGPIPARAGQPVPQLARVAAHRAYPRSRGATS